MKRLQNPSTGRRADTMNRFVALWILPTALLAFAAPASAGGLDRIGTSGAQELRIPVGAASVATGGSTVALGNGLQNIYWNPASLAGTDQSEAMVSYSSYLGDSKVNYGAIATSVGTQGEVGFSVKILNVGDIIVTTEDAPEGTGEVLNPSFGVFGITYGRRMTDRVHLGLTGSYISEKVADVSATGFALDLGVQYDTGWRGLRFGFAMKNIGPDMHYSGPNLEQRVSFPGDDPTATPHVVQLQAAPFELPSYLQIGVSYDIPMGGDRRSTIFGAFQGNNFNTDEYRLGAEVPIGGFLALRGGFVGQVPIKGADRQENYLYNFSYGAGFNFKLGDRPLVLDWAGTHVGDFFQDNQQVSLHIAF
ncbi:MAG TPA: PorV/PorQ family protein [Candidatus Limnocylindrales bacterium]|nr:PorV/PorQ family protein [Candidatus Limnocylindrales bacterium]